MPSKFSTVRRFAHAEITESESFGTGFAVFEAAVVLIVVVLDFFITLVFFFLGFDSSSSDSTLRGIALTLQPHNKNRIFGWLITWKPPPHTLTKSGDHHKLKPLSARIDCSSITLKRLTHSAFVIQMMPFSLPQQLHHLSSTTISSRAPGLNKIASSAEPYWSTYVEHLKGYSTQDEVQAAVEAWQHPFPGIPKPLFIFPGGPWPTLKPHYVHKGHLIEEPENFKMAVDNIEMAGMTVGDSDKEYLRYILCYPSGWGSTHPSHHNDSWVHYVKHRFPQVENLYPVLDDMTWPEEIDKLPDGYGPGEPGYFLLANVTSFYFYYHLTDQLLRAGSSLKEVYLGLLDRKWCYQTPSEDQWFSESNNGEEYDLGDYFPLWTHNRREKCTKSSYVLVDPILPFIPYPKHCGDE
jgi:hypothetical protein